MKTKLPWFKFYPLRWQGDAHLRLSSLSERGLLIEMMCLAHNGDPYGHLTNGGQAITEHDLRTMVASPYQTVRMALASLEHHGRIGRTMEGVFFVPSMVKQEGQHKQHVEDGTLGGNPELTKGVKPKVKGSNTTEEEEEEEKKKKKKQKRLRVDYSTSPHFEEFWKAYPTGRGGSKKEAYDQWVKFGIEKDETLRGQIGVAVEAQKEWHEKMDSQGEFYPQWPHACRWIKKQRWDDEKPPEIDKTEKPEEEWKPKPIDPDDLPW